MIKNVFGLKKQYHFEPPIFQVAIGDRVLDSEKEAKIDLSNFLAPSLSDVTLLTIKGNYLQNCGISDNDVLICSKFDNPIDGNLVYVKHINKKIVMLFREINTITFIQEVDTKKQIEYKEGAEYSIVGVIKHIIQDKKVHNES